MTTNLEHDIVTQEESNLLVAQHANVQDSVSLKDSLLTQLAQLKRTVDQLEGEGDWKGRLEASEKEVGEYCRRVFEQAIMLAEKADSIIALGDYHKKEAMLLKEKDAARKAVEAEQQAKADLQSRWTREREETRRQRDFDDKKLAAMDVEMNHCVQREHTL